MRKLIRTGLGVIAILSLNSGSNSIAQQQPPIQRPTTGESLAAPKDRFAKSLPLEIGSQRELFVHDLLIERLRNVEFQLQRRRNAEVVLLAGQPWEGEFTIGANVIRHAGDEIGRIVAWKSGTDVSSLTGNPVRLRFVMSEADLFSMKFNP